MDDLSRRDFLSTCAGIGALLVLPSAGDLVVHEWGVATIPYGTPGANLRSAGTSSINGIEQLADVPKFVSTWDATVKEAIEDWKNAPTPVTKPIVYFYAKEKATLRVTVKFPDGRPSAWYPAADRYAPEPDFSNRGKGDPDLPAIEKIIPKNGLLAWDALFLDPEAADFPAATGWWETARKVDSVPVRREKEMEKFLFYDGLADFTPRAVVTWNKDGTVTISNDSPDAFPSVVAIRVKNGACFSATAPIAKKGAATLTLKKGVPELSLAGLYKKEADALVEIWREEFFKTDGVRVLIVLARAAYDRLLPLEIIPAPKELERVLIAHLECLDDDRIATIRAWIGDFATGDIEARDLAARKLRQLGPLSQPMIREAAEKATDTEVKARLLELLKR